MNATSGSIYVSYGQFYLKGSEYFDTEEWNPSQGNGFLTALDEPGVPAVPGQFAIIQTGTRSGTINLTVDILDSRPAEEDLDGWDDVAEVSLRIEEEDLLGIGTVEDAGGDDKFPVFPEGDCRVRVHARGRQAARADPDSTRVQEELLILVWPADPEPQSMLKHGILRA